MEMKAAILAAQGEPLVIDSVQLPTDLSPGQALVKVHYTSVCGSQVAMIDGKRGKDPYLPHLLGHEGSGTVEEVGPGVRTVAEGDRVVLHCGIGEGIESETPSYRWNGNPLNAGWVTTFNQYAIVSENRLTPIPANFDLKLAPLFGCATLTGLGAIGKAGIEPGNSVVILGAGGVGLNLIQGAALVSAHPIVAVDLSDEKLHLARQLDATHCVNAKECDLSREITRIVGDTLADVVIDSTGHVEMLEMAYQLTRTDGVTMLISGPKAGYNVSLNPEPLHFGADSDGISGDNRESSPPANSALHQTGKRGETETQGTDNRFRPTQRHQYGGRKDAEWGTHRAVYHRTGHRLRRGA